MTCSEIFPPHEQSECSLIREVGILKVLQTERSFDNVRIDPKSDGDSTGTSTGAIVQSLVCRETGKVPTVTDFLLGKIYVFVSLEHGVLRALPLFLTAEYGTATWRSGLASIINKFSFEVIRASEGRSKRVS